MGVRVVGCTQEKWWKKIMKLKGYYNLYKDNAKIASVTKFIYKLVVILKKLIILHNSNSCSKQTNLTIENQFHRFPSTV